MIESRAPKERCIDNFTKPFDSQITPYDLSEFYSSVKSYCKGRKNQPCLKIGKIIFLGDIGVGKTSIINRFREGIFDYESIATVGVDILLEGFDILGLPFNIQIWDTAGQERFKCICSSYFKGTSVVVLVFDLLNVDSLLHCEQWLDLALKSCSSHQPFILLVGNKLDGITTSAYDGIKQIAIPLAKSLKAEYWTVSSRSGMNVCDLFHRIAFLSFVHVVFNEITSEDMQKETNIRLNEPIDERRDPKPSTKNCFC